MFPPAPVNPSALVNGLPMPPGGGGAPAPMGPGPGPAPNGQGGGAPDLTVVMGAIRDLGANVESLSALVPSLDPEVQQIRQILRRMVMKAGQAAPQQTSGADMLPMG